MHIRLSLLFILSVPAFGDARTATRTGDWSSPATWGGYPVPVDGDTCTINNGITVTVTDDEACGGSGPSGTVGITIVSGGFLVVGDGGTFHARGDTTIASPGNPNAPQLVIGAGGAWEFDSSEADRPRTTRYVVTQTTNGFGQVASYGSAESHAVVRSNSGGGNGYFTRSVNFAANGYTGTYTDFLRIGDSLHSAFTVANPGGSAQATWNTTNSTFTSCGLISGSNSNGLQPGDIFIHTGNVHTGSVGGAIFSFFPNNNATLAGGARDIKRNVFDQSLDATFDFWPGAFTISGNYMAESAGFYGFTNWALWTNNFQRFGPAYYSGGSFSTALGDMSNTYFFIDGDAGNPHVLSGCYNLSGAIFGQAGTALGPPGITDSGEFFFLSDAAVPTTCGLYNSIILPNMAGYSSLEIGSLVGTFTNIRAVVEHNTWFGGFSRGTVPTVDGGFPAIQLGETGSIASGSLASFRSNILWNPQKASYLSSFYKLSDISRSSTPAVDYCAPALCDYNTGYGHTPANTGFAQFANQGKGYAASFSSPPGVHDVDVDPKFADWQRSVELFDSKYLGNRPAAWNAKTHYQVGDFVSNSRPDVYWGLPANYRYVGGTTCLNGNPEPGNATRWRDCWEWASLYRMRQAIAASTTWLDGALYIEGDTLCKRGTALDAVAAVTCWIRKGYISGAQATWGKAHDGKDIGAVPSSRVAHSLALGLP